MNPLRLATPLALTPLLTAQFQGPIRGPFSALPQAVSLHAPDVHPAIQIKQTGDSAQAPGTYPSTAKWSLAKMFPSLTPAQRSALDIDAMSTGNDLLFVDTSNNQGRIQIPGSPLPLAWAAVHFSVKADTVGLQGSTISVRRQTIGPTANIGSDLFGYYVDGSAQIPNEIVGKTFLEQRREDMVFANETMDVDALDLMLPLIVEYENAPYVADQFFENSFAPVQDKFFFSLSHQAVYGTELNGLSWDGQSLHPGNIYVITWDSTEDPPAWEAPRIFRRHDQLMGTNPDVDALAVNLYGGNEFVYYSLTRATTPTGDLRDQFYVHYTPTGAQDPVNAVMKTPQGEPVSRKVGISIDEEADGLCGSDPEVNTFCSMLGVPTEHDLPVHNHMTLSLARKHAARHRGMAMVGNVSGWPRNIAAAGTVDLWVRYPTDPATDVLIRSYTRTAFDRDLRIEFELPLLHQHSGPHHFWTMFTPSPNSTGLPGISHRSSFKF